MTTVPRAAATGAATDGLRVTIDASGPISGGVVHAVAVTQPVQSWVVLRNQNDFLQVGNALAQTIPGIPPCPQHRPDVTDINDIVIVRNEMQAWLNAILSHPRARESPAVRDFLVVEANMIPPQYEGVRWVKFPPVPQEPLVAAPIASGDGNTVEMEMEEMFDDDYDAPPHQQDAEDDDEFVPAASERYQQTREAVTAEDEMELTGEVEMVEDVGSLAQSMGASHLGRSLQLQAQMGHPTASNRAANAVTGLRLGGAVSPGGTPAAQGGIGSVIQNAGLPGQTPVQQQAMTSPRRLDSFTLLKVIGKGSFGKVFLAKEKSTGQIFALKVLRKDFVVRRNQVEHTKTERSVLGYVDHPFIVGMKMAFQSKDKLYFVLDYCPGGELFYHLGRLGRFPEHQARFYAAEIVLAISYVHQLDIIYRDLKPENVLLDDQGHVRLTDFGLSKEGISGSSSGANSFCGTPEYLAPEIVDRRGHGRAVDWWSLGALLHEMLTGLPPFYCQDRERLFEKIRKETLRFPPSLSASAKSVLSGLLERDPDKRLGSGPTDAEEIKAHSFFSVIDWNKLQIGEITPPWKPPVQGSADTSQFDTEFTTMPIFSPQSHQHRLGTTPAGGNHFEGFSYTNPALFGSGSGTKS